MLPTTPSLLSRPLCGTLRRGQCAPSVAAVAKSKSHLRPSLRVPHRQRPFVNYPYAYIPTPLPCSVPSEACNCTPRPIVPIPKMRDHHSRWKAAWLDWLKVGGAGLCLAMTFLAAPVIYCEAIPAKSTPTSTTSLPQHGQEAATSPVAPPPPPPPQSSVNYYELTFGTVCGVCAGVFVKKGARIVAFTLGGVFVLLQYLGSLSLVRVDWSRAAGRFENLFYTKDVKGVSRAPNIGSLFRWIVDFLTADFQPRATFIAGFMLGLRVG